jgi:hypothetical protein
MHQEYWFYTFNRKEPHPGNNHSSESQFFYHRFKRQQVLRYSYLKNLPITPDAGKTRIVD